MSDSDIEDSFFLEALEEIEKSVLYTDAVHHKNANSIEKEASPLQENSHFTSAEKKDDFRSNLLKTLIHSKNSTPKENVGKKPELNSQNPKVFKRKFNENSQESQILDDIITPKFPKYVDNDTSLKSNENAVKVNEKLPVVSPLQKHAFSNNRCSSVIKKRKFPGPAGLLSHTGSRPHLKPELPVLDENPVKESLCSQNTANDFFCGPWKQMRDDLARVTESVDKLMQIHNVRAIIRKGTLNGRSSIRKVPFIAVMVKNLDPSYVDATAVFYDETGEIPGTISKDVIEKYSYFISPGCVFLLKDVTVLSPAGLKPGVAIMSQLKKQYLNVTVNSVIAIYNSEDEDSIKKVIPIMLTKELIESFSSSSENFKERKQLIENEEKKESALFENISGNRYSTPQKTNIPPYKKPISCTPSASTSGELYHYSNPTHLSKPSSFSTPSFKQLSSQSHISDKPDKRNDTVLNSNFVSDKSDPSSTKCQYVTMGDDDDDDELDFILANIDVDVF